MKWNVEKEGDEIYITVDGIRSVGDSGKVNVIDQCSSGNTKDEIWFKLQGEKNGKRLKRSMVDGSNEKLAMATTNVEFLQQLEDMGIPVGRKTKKSMNRTKTSVDTTLEQIQLPTPEPDQTSVPDNLMILKQKSAGHFTVNVDRLTNPNKGYLVREVNDQWVNQIKTSIRRQPSAPVTRIPVLCDKEIPPEEFRLESAHEPLQTLGGNHLMTAIKEILIEEDGNSDFNCLRQVDVEIYVGLTEREALFVSSWHNNRCLQRPMQFQDKVILARKIFEKCEENWKEEVVLALGDLDRKTYKMEGLSTVLSVASYGTANWQLTERMFSAASEGPFPQNIFRQLQSVEDSDRSTYLSRAIGSNCCKMARHIIEDKRKSHMKQLACAILEAPTWDDIESTYMLASSMLQYTGDLSTPAGRNKFAKYIKEKADNEVEDLVITINVKRNGQEIEITPAVLEACTSKIKKFVMRTETSKEE